MGLACSDPMLLLCWKGHECTDFQELSTPSPSFVSLYLEGVELTLRRLAVSGRFTVKRRVSLLTTDVPFLLITGSVPPDGLAQKSARLDALTRKTCVSGSRLALCTFPVRSPFILSYSSRDLIGHDGLYNFYFRSDCLRADTRACF